MNTVVVGISYIYFPIVTGNIPRNRNCPLPPIAAKTADHGAESEHNDYYNSLRIPLW